jgi:hypothetical protein
MQNRPTREELLRGVAHFLREEALPQLEGPAKFHARVAARAVDMVLRELESGDADLTTELERLANLLGEAPPDPAGPGALAPAVAQLNRRLVERIRAGDADQGHFRESTMDHLRRVTVSRLAVNNPEMAERARREFGM